jgi:hypothetical protein
MVGKCIRCAQAASTNEELGALQKAALTCYDETSSVLPPQTDQMAEARVQAAVRAEQPHRRGGDLGK